MALAVGRRPGATHDPPALDQLDSAVLGAPEACRALDVGGDADAEQLVVAVGTPAGLLCAQRVVVGSFEGSVHAGFVGAGVVPHAGLGLEREPLGRQEVLPAHLDGVHPDLRGEHIDGALDGRGGLRTAGAPERADGGRIGQHRHGAEAERGDVVAAGQHRLDVAGQRRSGVAVRAGVLDHPYLERGDVSVGSPADAAVLDLPAPVHQADHVVAPGRHPHHRPPEPIRQPAQQGLLGMGAGLRAEAAADVAGEHAHLVALEAEHHGQRRTHRVGSLAGVHVMQAPVVGPAAGRHPGLQRARGDAVVHRAHLGHHLARIEIGLPAVHRHAQHHVRLCHALEQRGGTERFLGIGECRQGLVVDDDQLGGVDRRCCGLGYHHRYGLAHKSDSPFSQHGSHDGGIERRAGGRVRREVHIGRGDHVDDTSSATGFADVEPDDLCVRDRGGHVARMRDAVPRGIRCDIGNELPLSAQQRLVLAPDDRCSS